MITLIWIAFALRLVNLADQALWYDELQSVTYAVLPFDQILYSLSKLDPHPPLYYSQLHFWLLFGTNDLWIQFNSLAFSLVTMTSLFVVASKRFDPQAGLMTAIFFAINPFAIFYAQEVRMYALLMLLGVWIYFFTDRLLKAEPTFAHTIGLMSTTLLYLYSHGAGFLLIASTLVYAIGSLFQAQTAWHVQRRHFFFWGKVQLLILLCYLPWLYHAISITLRHTIRPDLAELLKTLSLLLLGFGPLPMWVRWAAVLALLALLMLLFVRVRESRLLVIAFVIVPIVTTLLISYLYRPIWHHRPLAYVVPFLTIALALGSKELPRAWIKREGMRPLRHGLFAVVAVVLLTTVVIQQRHEYYPWHIRKAVTYLQSVARAGDTIYVPDFKVYWGASWYFAGPGEVHPLNAATMRAERSGITLYSNSSEAFAAVSTSCDWVLYRTMDIPQLAPGITPIVVQDFDDLMVARCD